MFHGQNLWLNAYQHTWYSFVVANIFLQLKLSKRTKHVHLDRLALLFCLEQVLRLEAKAPGANRNSDDVYVNNNGIQNIAINTTCERQLNNKLKWLIFTK